MHSTNIILITFMAILSILTFATAEPIPASMEGVAKRGEGRAYCCHVGCTSCNSAECDFIKCWLWPHTSCCALGVVDVMEDGSLRGWNAAGQLIEWDTSPNTIAALAAGPPADAE